MSQLCNTKFGVYVHGHGFVSNNPLWKALKFGGIDKARTWVGRDVADRVATKAKEKHPSAEVVEVIVTYEFKRIPQSASNCFQAVKVIVTDEFKRIPQSASK